MVILLGSCLYTWIKARENQRRAASSASSQNTPGPAANSGGVAQATEGKAAAEKV
jgi:hypothetical protein